MDSLISTAAKALDGGDIFGALNRVALREDPPALALRGIAMARLGDLARARMLLRRAARGFGARAAVARARCQLAEAEIALAMRDLAWPGKSLEATAATLSCHGDLANAAFARLLNARRLLLIGRLDEAAQLLGDLAPERLAPASRAVHALAQAGLAMRRVQAAAARYALARAKAAADQANLPPLTGEVESAHRMLEAPAARLIRRGSQRTVRLDEVEALFGSGWLVVDACRRALRAQGAELSLATRPVLFALLRRLAEAWPEDVAREELAAYAFGARRFEESERVRLRVEIGRLRSVLRGIADLTASKRGFLLCPAAPEAVVLAPPGDDDDEAVLALLADGEAWSSSALALALGASQRTVQRALEALASLDRVRPCGAGARRRWVSSAAPGYATSLLLPAPMAGG